MIKGWKVFQVEGGGAGVLIRREDLAWVCGTLSRNRGDNSKQDTLGGVAQWKDKTRAPWSLDDHLLDSCGDPISQELEDIYFQF